MGWAGFDADWLARRKRESGARITRERVPRVEPVYPLVNLCLACGLPAPLPEYEFHPLRKWRFDYAWPARWLALEIEGGIWRDGGGAHSHPLNIVRDLEKYTAGAVLGWRILRVQPAAMADLSVLGLIGDALKFQP